MNAKRAYYEKLLSRLSTAIAKEFFLEAVWIAYTVIEDRAVSALDKTGGVPTTSKGYPVGLEQKIRELKKRRKQDESLAKAFYRKDFFSEMHLWRKDRNDFAHELASNPRPWESLMVEAKALADKGELLAREISSSVARFKRRSRRKR